MAAEFHYSTARLLDEIRAHPDDVAAHVLECEACRYVFALVRRASGLPSDEDSEVVLDALRDWRAV